MKFNFATGNRLSVPSHLELFCPQANPYPVAAKSQKGKKSINVKTDFSRFDWETMRSVVAEKSFTKK